MVILNFFVYYRCNGLRVFVVNGIPITKCPYVSDRNDRKLLSLLRLEDIVSFHLALIPTNRNNYTQAHVTQLLAFDNS